MDNHLIEVKTNSTMMGIGYAVLLDGVVLMTCYGPNAHANALKEADKGRARLSHQPDPQ